MEIKPFESATLGVVKLVVNDVSLVDGDVKESQKTYHLVLDFNAMATALKMTGLDLTRTASWANMALDNLQIVCWTAFRRFHPEVTLEEVGRILSPAKQEDVKGMLMDLAYPGWTERIVKYAEELKKQQQEAEAKGESPGESQPAAEEVKL
jgi:hypothetical protein